MFRIPNLFAKPNKVARASKDAVPTRAVGEYRRDKLNTMHSRLLGFVAKDRPERAEAITAKLSLAASLNEGRGA